MLQPLQSNTQLITWFPALELVSVQSLLSSSESSNYTLMTHHHEHGQQNMNFT